ncbi:MAG: sensor histidine kinase, partial [Dehalococcoidia bacterium]
AYPVDLVDRGLDAVTFRDICLSHSTVLPGDGSLASEALLGAPAPAPGHLSLLIEARRTAEHALAQRDYFLSAAAHELRTPLTGILGYVQLLLRREATEGGLPGGSLRALGNISVQAQRMRALIDQLLDAAESNSEAMPLARQALDLRDLLTSAAGRARVDRRAISIAGPSVEVLVDAARIEQVLANLLQNAQRHSAPGRPIEIAIERGEESVSFSVRDHGPGIARERHARIFDRFIHEHPAEQGAGLGLGLYLSREIVEAHGGTIAIESPEDGGSRFIVTLPLPPTDRTTA